MLFDIDKQIDTLINNIHIDEKQKIKHLQTISEYHKLFNDISDIVVKNYTLGKEDKKIISLLKKHGKDY